MRDGLEFVSLGFNRLEAESDSSQVIDFFTWRTQLWDAASAIFVECVDTVSIIEKVMFKHCLRTANQAAHVLANHSYCNKISFFWLHEPYDVLANKLVDDVSII